MKILRGKTGTGEEGKKLDPKASEFVPENEMMGRKVVWVGGWWVEE